MPGQSREDGGLTSSIRETVLGLLAWVLVLGLGFRFTLLVKATSWWVILPVEFALLGLVVLVAALSVRKGGPKP
ncbi:MAG: hypothetical protein FJ020_03500 [Chloroflexi bacterium]|nr:hypothetical protein [Chloroflexota bacterium]